MHQRAATIVMVALSLLVVTACTGSVVVVGGTDPLEVIRLVPNPANAPDRDPSRAGCGGAGLGVRHHRHQAGGPRALVEAPF